MCLSLLSGSIGRANQELIVLCEGDMTFRAKDLKSSLPISTMPVS
jgi:hypothetical protein